MYNICTCGHMWFGVCNVQCTTLYIITPKVGVDFDTEARVMYTCTSTHTNVTPS